MNSIVQLPLLNPKGFMWLTEWYINFIIVLHPALPARTCEVIFRLEYCVGASSIPNFSWSILTGAAKTFTSSATMDPLVIHSIMNGSRMHGRALSFAFRKRLC